MFLLGPKHHHGFGRRDYQIGGEGEGGRVPMEECRWWMGRGSGGGAQSVRVNSVKNARGSH